MLLKRVPAVPLAPPPACAQALIHLLRVLSFVLLCAGTSAVSIDQERKLYEAAASLDISCVTISQRLSLPEFHSQEIKLGQPTADGFRLQPIAKVESE